MSIMYIIILRMKPIAKHNDCANVDDGVNVHNAFNNNDLHEDDDFYDGHSDIHDENGDICMKGDLDDVHHYDKYDDYYDQDGVSYYF